ncbi:AAA-like domain-containing protein [Lyngbya confervoides]|uniref:non-specific serine/threonine protein kinase n=1 Tax=Lyngbya confervoides BDU141951 TaxID=1574623 RepID=A0ABD4T8U7_9CYAN|nr:AAA-like domain-containing protein [Lyngbya confervoides]MCM1984863.1 AAA-like domain-containing protein [Lyngbya confervoides BDU141951]
MGETVLSGRYQILRSLGGGSFGQTHLALDTQRPHSPTCVVKHLRPLRQDSEFMATARSLFQREAETLEKLGCHDQIPRLLAYFESQNEFYLVQDYIPGSLLSQELLPQHPWTEAQAISLLQDILGILQFIHSLGVIHRDLKPDNLIRRQSDGKLVLIDFGAVKHIQTAFNTPAERAKFGDTITIGTPGYMAPEQAQGRPRPGSDLYSLGVIGIQALTGQAPAQIEQGVDGNLQWQAAEPIHPKFQAILEQLVRYHFQDRYQDAAEVLEDLSLYTHPPRLWQRVKHLFLGSSLGSRGPVELSRSGELLSAPQDPAPVKLGTTIPRETPPASVPKTRVVLSAFSFSEDCEFSQTLYRRLQAAGYDTFIISQSQPMEATWVAQLHAALQSCDYYILIICPQTVHSEVLLQEVRTVKAMQGQQPHQTPRIIPIRVALPFDQPLNFELRGYLQRIQQYLWRSPQDTETILDRVLGLLESSPTTNSTAEIAGAAAPPTVPPQQNPTDALPLPVAEPEIPEGQVQIASAFYTERSPIERRCTEVIVQPGALIRIKAPRQMGKTSLMARTLHYAQQQGCATIALSLQLADSQTFQDLDRLLKWLCATVARRLRLPNHIKNNWDDIFGSKYNCTNYFEEHILPRIDRPLVLGFDEVDRVFEAPHIASDFFGLLRAWHEEAKNQEQWQKLRLIVVHATEVYIPLNANQSPFNVGLPIDLPPFNAEQIAHLATLHQLPWGTPEIQQIQRLVGGHPYLVRLAMYHLSQGDLSFSELLDQASDESGLFRDHLRGFWWKLQKNPELAQGFRSVLESREPVALEADILFKLHSLGLIQMSANLAQPRCDLYRRYFQARLSNAVPVS